MSRLVQTSPDQGARPPLVAFITAENPASFLLFRPPQTDVHHTQLAPDRATSARCDRCHVTSDSVAVTR